MAWQHVRDTWRSAHALYPRDLAALFSLGVWSGWSDLSHVNLEAFVGSSPLPLEHVVQSPRVQGLTPFPALLLLHGRGANELDLLSLADELDPRLFIISARAPIPFFDGFAWYQIGAIGEPEPASFGASLAALQRFVSQLPTAYPIDPSRIYSLGFSQGAVMAGSLLLTRPELVAGTIMLSGYLPVNLARPVDEARLAHRPAFVAHGTADPLIPIAMGRQARDDFLRLGVDLTYREYPIAHHIGAEELRDVADWLLRIGGS